MANLSIRKSEPREPMAKTWDPRGALSPLRTMDPFRMMDPLRIMRDMMSMDPFAGLVAPLSEMFAPDIELKETKDAYVIKADLPGVHDEDLEVSVTGNRLAVSGKREEEAREEDDRYFAYERSYGTFSRSFVMPEGADLDKVKAELKEGVLNITVPKKTEMQARKVEVSAAKEAKAETGKAEMGKAEPKKAA
jgi:HSP20 family protein